MREVQQHFSVFFNNVFPAQFQVTMLQGENALLNSYKSSMQNLEQDKSVLEEKVQSLESTVHSLEASLQESQANANIMANIDTSGMWRIVEKDLQPLLGQIRLGIL